MTKASSAWAAAMARRKAAKMTKRQRSEHGRKMALARWAKKSGQVIIEPVSGGHAGQDEQQDQGRGK